MTVYEIDIEIAERKAAGHAWSRDQLAAFYRYMRRVNGHAWTRGIWRTYRHIGKKRCPLY